MYGFSNPRRRHRRHHRNPVTAGAATMREWTQGVDATDAVAAVAGLAGATMIPGMLIKITAGAVELTTTQKFLKVAVALGAAVGIGAAARSFMSPSAGKAAVIGGLAGAGTQIVNMMRPGTIGRMALPNPGRRLSESTVISPAPGRESETVSLIQP